MDAGNAGRLRSGLKKLRMKWDILGDSWQDAVRTDFENEHLEPLDHELTMTAKELEQLSQTIRRALRDCE